MPLSSAGIINYLEQSLQVDQKIDGDTGLFSTGVLDSVAMLQVITYIEDEAAVTVRAEEVTLENFDTVNRILRLIAEKSAK